MAPNHADGDESSVTPTSALLESAYGGVGSGNIGSNQNMNRTSLHPVGQNVFQASQQAMTDLVMYGLETTKNDDCDKTKQGRDGHSKWGFMVCKSC